MCKIETILGLRLPIYWGDWAIEEKAALLISHKVASLRPSIIVELGSGVSTIIMAKTVEKLGLNTKIYSIDSDEIFLRETQNRVKAEKLSNYRSINFVYAPLKKYVVSGKSYRWYDIKKEALDFDKIDILFVDGPPGSVNKNARYPAVPLLNDYLGPGTVIILDDSKRKEEKEIADSWLLEVGGIRKIENYETERGITEIYL